MWEFTGSNVNISGAVRDITIDFGRSATSGILTVKGQNLCGIGLPSQEYTISINPLPSTPAAIDGSPIVCQGQDNVAFSVAAANNASTYIWNFSGAGATINGNTNQVTVDFAPTATAGNLSVQGVNTCGIGNASAAYYVSVNLLPGTPQTISGTTDACQNQNGIPYSVPQVANASAYVWEYSGNGAIVNGSGTNVTIDFTSAATSGILTVRGYNNNCGVGAPSVGLPINILTSLPQTPGSITGPSTVCQGQGNIVFSVDSIINAQSYIWQYSGIGATVTGNGKTVTISFSPSATSGILTVKGANTCGYGVEFAGSPHHYEYSSFLCRFNYRNYLFMPGTDQHRLFRSPPFRMLILIPGHSQATAQLLMVIAAI